MAKRLDRKELELFGQDSNDMKRKASWNMMAGNDTKKARTGSEMVDWFLRIEGCCEYDAERCSISAEVTTLVAIVEVCANAEVPSSHTAEAAEVGGFSALSWVEQRAEGMQASERLKDCRLIAKGPFLSIEVTRLYPDERGYLIRIHAWYRSRWNYLKDGKIIHIPSCESYVLPRKSAPKFMMDQGSNLSPRPMNTIAENAPANRNRALSAYVTGVSSTMNGSYLERVSGLAKAVPKQA
ncbi:hypothetical protein K469DRAFT_694471 [Zopfia rhizophila CBS 207.26]|uniref:Uncharacterized protein n=1 Tax=Zopfia rhizophila CBS 207.26 TaxID=1314779 RepID=A0A6A6EQI3_9PEZI|nr:hypothetical protein K469DRAFT_694471 [Zopfia rhizophila CBS 207.26]